MKMTRRLRLVLSALGLALVSAVGDCYLVVHVDGANVSGVEDGSAAHPFATIQKAIDQTSNPVAVVIAPGTYAGFHIFGRTGVHLQAADITAPVIDGAALASPLITISGSSDTELRDLTIQIGSSDGVWVTDGGSVALVGVTVTAPLPPPWPDPAPTSRLVVADPGTTVVVDGSTLTGGGTAVYAKGPSTSVTVEGGSVLSHNYRGAWVLDGSQLEIAASTIESSSAYGVGAHSTVSLTTTADLHTGTSILGAGSIGVVAGPGASATISDSLVQAPSTAEGVRAESGADVVATNATLDGGYYAVAAKNGGVVELVHCTVRNAGGGVIAWWYRSEVLIREGSIVEKNSTGVTASFSGRVTIDGSSVIDNGEGVVVESGFQANSNLTVRNGSIIANNAGAGVTAASQTRSVVTNSSILSNGTDGFVCAGDACDIGAGAGLGNTISGHSGAGHSGITCVNAGVANCAAGENTFSDNATDIDPACAATCPH